MAGTVAGFDWDHGNRAKCRQHGVTPEEVEAIFDRPVLIVPDEGHSQSEERLRAIGKTAQGRSIFPVFTIRERDGGRLIRRITARYMHRQEIASYEEDNPDL